MYEDSDELEYLKQEQEELHKKAKEITSLYKAVFGTELGKKCLDMLENSFVNRDIYKTGMPLDEVAFRQGEASVIKKIIKEISKNG